jgi:hypothetical protein
MKASKALGLGGFSAGFFHKAWPVVGDGLIAVVLEFFSSGILLKEVNAKTSLWFLKRRTRLSWGITAPFLAVIWFIKPLSRFWLISYF